MRRIRKSQIARYIMTGGATTANCAAWLFAVIFSFFANRELVFHSTGSKIREFMQFFWLRLATLASETLLLFALIEGVGCGNLLSKVLVSVITVILNYLTCRYGIFNKGGISDE